MGGCLGEYHANSSIVDMIHAYSEYALSVKHIKYEPVGKGSNPGISRVGEARSKRMDADRNCHRQAKN